MDFKALLLTSCVLITALTSVIFISYLTSLILRLWRETRSAKPIWRNRYPSFEEFHALFDRGDIMFSTVIVAACLQLSHPRLSKAIKMHSTYKTDPWRRLIRTMAFIYIMIRATSSERQAVIAWLRRLHGSIPMFKFETNTVVFATFAWGLVRTHQFLGNTSPEQVDGIVKGVMAMADQLDPQDRGKKVPATMAEVERFLENELSFDPEELLKVNQEYVELSSLRHETKKHGVGKFLRRPLTSLRLFLFRRFAFDLSHDVLAQDCHRSRSNLGRLFWWFTRKVHCFLSYFHYSTCPTTLTFDGTLNLLVEGVPGMENVSMELYQEIFGGKNGAPLDAHSEKALRPYSDMNAHLPKMKVDEQLMTMVSGLPEEASELIKCSYYRGKLAQSAGHPPRHLGVIMDGNRRYSRRKGFKSVLTGHQHGASKILQVTAWTFSSGIQNLTVWALSDDKLKRPPEELNPLFSMMAEFIGEMMTGEIPFSVPDVRFRVVGNRSILPDFLRDMIAGAEAATAKNTRFNLQIALGYGGRSEVTRATKLAVNAKMTREGLSPEAAIERITEADISCQTYSSQLNLPQIDAIIRTSGENRLSGFALWDSHHAEFAIIEENWPALRQSTFLRSLLDLSKRNRRFGA